jgi:two-component system, NarL family, nitrate/nitrite response regulator NarL
MPSIVSVIVDPSRIFREGLTSILAKTPFEPACTASSTQDVPSTISDAAEQILVLIGVREGSDLAEALRAMKATFPDAHVVVVGDASKCDNVTIALELGATSFIDENLATSTLVKELELVAQGEPVISVFIFKLLLGHRSAPGCCKSVPTPAVEVPPSPDTRGQAEQRPQLSRPEPVVEVPQSPDTQGQTQQRLQLSGRQAAILSGLVQGASNKVIAYQLKITEATVKVHVKAILRKIRVRNRTQAAIWALKCQGSPKRLSAEGNGSSLRQGSLGGERSDIPMIDQGLPKGSGY